MKPGTIEELKQVRYVTEHYNGLQGLVFVSMGLAFLVMAVEEAGWLTWLIGERILAFFLSILLVILLFLCAWGAHIYYNRTFGRVEFKSSNSRFQSLQIFVILASITVAYLVDLVAGLPVSITGLLVAMYCIIFWVKDQFRWYLLIVAALFGVVSVLSLLGIIPAEQMLVRNSTTTKTVVGLIMVIGGIIDHLLLVRTLKKVPEESNDRAI